MASDAACPTRHVIGGYREYAPPADLSPFVGALWLHRSGSTGPVRHRVVPEPDVSVCYRTRASKGVEEPDGFLLIGAVDHARIYDPLPGVSLYAVRLKPEWCLPLLGTHPAEHRDAIEDLVTIRPDIGRPLLDDLSRLRSPAQVLERLGEAVRNWAARSRVVPAVSTAHGGLERLRRAGPGATIEDICRDWGVSSRHLRRSVQDATGTSPKRMLRAKRLTRALFQADARERPPWSRIALASGYCDQSHFIRECRALTGAPPGTIHAERRTQGRGADST